MPILLSIYSNWSGRLWAACRWPSWLQYVLRVLISSSHFLFMYNRNFNFLFIILSVHFVFIFSKSMWLFSCSVHGIPSILLCTHIYIVFRVVTSMCLHNFTSFAAPSNVGIFAMSPNPCTIKTKTCTQNVL